MSKTSNHLRTLTHFIMTLMVMIRLLTFHMEIIHLNNKFPAKTIMELAGSGNEACNTYIKQINHKTNIEFE